MCRVTSIGTGRCRWSSRLDGIGMQRSGLDVLAIVVFIGANLVGIEMYVLLGSIDVGTIVGGITAVSAATLAMVRILTPVVADSIKVIGPALAELQKQRDEIRKGSLAGQMEEMRTNLAEMSARVEDANKKLHDANDRAQAENLKFFEEERHTKEMLAVLTEELRSARKELDKLRMENRRLMSMTAKQLRVNKEGIEEMRSISDSTLARVNLMAADMEGAHDPECGDESPGGEGAGPGEPGPDAKGG